MGYRPPIRLQPPQPPPDAKDVLEGNVAYLKSKYVTGFITLAELEEGLESVLAGGPVNVSRAAPNPRLGKGPASIVGGGGMIVMDAPIVAPPKRADARRSAVPPWVDAR